LQAASRIKAIKRLAHARHCLPALSGGAQKGISAQLNPLLLFFEKSFDSQFLMLISCSI
jgi:hypothetical protein